MKKPGLPAFSFFSIEKLENCVFELHKIIQSYLNVYNKRELSVWKSTSDQSISDEIIVFHQLDKSHLNNIIEIELKEVRDRLQEKNNTKTITPNVIKTFFFLSICYLFFIFKNQQKSEIFLVKKLFLC